MIRMTVAHHHILDGRWIETEFLQTADDLFLD